MNRAVSPAPNLTIGLNRPSKDAQLNFQQSSCYKFAVNDRIPSRRPEIDAGNVGLPRNDRLHCGRSGGGRFFLIPPATITNRLIGGNRIDYLFDLCTELVICRRQSRFSSGFKSVVPSPPLITGLVLMVNSIVILLHTFLLSC